MDYGQLTGSTSVAGSVARWVNTSQIVNDVPEIIAEAESWIYRRLRHWKMLVPPVAGALTPGSDTLALPADLLEPNELYLTGIWFARIPQKTELDVLSAWSFDGNGNRIQTTPAIYYFNQSYIQFDSQADIAYPYALTYYQQPAPLSATNTTNFLTSTYPRMMRCALMAAACEFVKDNGQGNFDRTYWDQLCQDEIDKAQMESDRARRAVEAGAQFMGGTGNGAQPVYVW